MVHVARVPHHAPPDPEALRRWIQEIGQARPAEAFAPDHNHTALAAVLPTQGFAHWRILPGWVEETAKKRGAAWNNCRLILRLYDVSYIHFNGFNATPEKLPDATLGTSPYKEFRGSDGTEEKTPAPGRVVFLATNGLVPSLDLKHHGLFTKVVRDGLKGG